MDMAERPAPRWPKAGDKVFLPQGSMRDLAQLNAFVTVSSTVYAVGFQMAADKIIQAALQDDCYPDLLFAPVGYLYRHYLELTLTHLVRLGLRIGAMDLDDKCLEVHDLHALWVQSRKLIEAAWPNADRADTDAVESVIMEFHRLDKSGQAFRYGTDKRGHKHLDGIPEFVSLAQARSTMEAVSNFLDGAVAGIEACDPG